MQRNSGRSPRYKIFISSTVFDLLDLRAELVGVMAQEARRSDFEVVHFERLESFPLGGKRHAHDVCIDAVVECSMLLLIIGSSYGQSYEGSRYIRFRGISIVHAEMRAAIERELDLLICARRQVLDELDIYNFNKSKGIEISPRFVKDTRVFELLNEAKTLRSDNWIISFGDVVELKREVRSALRKYRRSPAPPAPTKPSTHEPSGQLAPPTSNTMKGWQIGPLAIPLRILLGGELIGNSSGAYLREFSRDNIECRFITETPPLPSKIESSRAGIVAKLKDDADTSGRDFFNGGCFRLHNYFYRTTDVDSEDYKMVLDIGGTDFFTFASTNLSLDINISEGQTFREKYHAQIQDFAPDNFLSNRITVILNVFLSDGRLIVIRRSRNVFLRPGVYQTSVAGGMKRLLRLGSLSGDLDESGQPSPFVTASRECKSELNLEINKDEVKFLALAQDLEWLAPILIGEIHVPFTENELRAHVPLAGEKGEIRSIELIEFTVAEACKILTTREFAADSVVAILLSLMHQYSPEAVLIELEGQCKTK